MKDKIIDFNTELNKKKADRSAELDALSEQVDKMDMDAAIRYMLGMEGGSLEAAEQYCDTQEKVHGANLKIRE